MMRVRMRVRRWIWIGAVLSGVGAAVAWSNALGQGIDGSAAARLGINTSAGVAVSEDAGSSQGTSVSPATSVGGVMRGLASRAGVVFVGQVERIETKEGVVEITFLVLQPVLGVVAGTYVEREWAGRWVGGQQRYRLGQTAMFFLHAPSAAGLSSPVDGMAGVVPLVPMGADGITLLDVRMLATRVVRPIGLPLADAAFGAISLGDAEALVTRWRATDEPEPERRSLPVGMVPEPASSSPGNRLLLGQVSRNTLPEPQDLYSQEKYDAQR